MRTAVVAYSGGLDTSCILAWLQEAPYGFDEVVPVLVDVGQEFDLDESIVRADEAGAEEVLVVDRTDAFADEQCAGAIAANALYEGKYPLVSALSRPVIAQAVAEVALELDAEAVVHGCTGKGNDQLRFELAFKAHYPGVKVIAPLRDRIWTRDEEIEYALSRGIPVAQTASSPYSIDENLFGRSIEAGVLEDPWNATTGRALCAHVGPGDRACPGRDRRRLRAGHSGLPRRRGPAARSADRAGEPAGRRLRDRADRHDREPGRRDQEPRGVRGSGSDHADHGALGARRRRPHQGRGAAEAPS